MNINSASPAWLAQRRAMESLTLRLLQENRVSSWKVSFDGSLTHKGRCSHEAKTITYSSALMAFASEEERRNAVLHEVAHALLGAGHGHGKRWQDAYLKLGGTRMSEVELQESEAWEWTGTCPTCFSSSGMAEEPTDVWGCTICPKNTPVSTRIYSWAHRGESVAIENLSEAYSAALRSVLEAAA